MSSTRSTIDRVRLSSPNLVLQAASLAVLAAVAASGLMTVLGIDPLDHLDWVPACAIRTWTGIACPGCGMTRALVLLGQLQFAASCSSHPAAPGLVIALGVGAVRPGLLSARWRDAVVGVALAFVVGVWLVRSVA
jgi:hypothetical protein